MGDKTHNSTDLVKNSAARTLKTHNSCHIEEPMEFAAHLRLPAFLEQTMLPVPLHWGHCKRYLLMLIYPMN